MKNVLSVIYNQNPVEKPFSDKELIEQKIYTLTFIYGVFTGVGISILSYSIIKNIF